MTKPLRVIKLGGSLLLYEGLPSALLVWLARQAPAANLLIAGGGALVDAIRAADEQHRFAAADSHELAMGCLSVTARMLAFLVPEAALLIDSADLTAWHRNAERAAIFDLGAAWRDGDWRATLSQLPSDWTTTSDSLAAVVAARLEASELVLLKSADPPASASPAELAAMGFVDRAFPLAIGGLPVRCVNLRRPVFAKRQMPN